jgi:anti-sigma regulatory factor (Ser/Thr protein kinase)
VKELSLHILDLLQNSVKANATHVQVAITEDLQQNMFSIVIADNGQGINNDLLATVTNPFTTTRTTRRVGLGLSLLKAAAERCNGSLTVQSEAQKGTTVTTIFEHNHIDRAPLGDIVATLMTFLIGNPQVDLRYHHRVDGNDFEFETETVKQELGDLPLTEPSVVNFLTEYLQTHIAKLYEGEI